MREIVEMGSIMIVAGDVRCDEFPNDDDGDGVPVNRFVSH